MNSTAYSFTHGPFTSDDPSCVAGNTYTSILSNGSALPSFIAYDPSLKQYTVYSNSDSDVGTYSVELIFGGGTYTFNTTFEVLIQYFDFCSIKVVTPPSVGSQAYQVNSPALVISLGAWMSDPSNCLNGYSQSI